MVIEIKQLVVSGTNIPAGYGVVVNRNGNRRVAQVMQENNLILNDEFLSAIDDILPKPVSWRPAYFRKNLDKMYFVGSDGMFWYEAINSYGSYAPMVYHAIAWKGAVLPTNQPAITKIRKNNFGGMKFIPFEPIDFVKEIEGYFGFPDYILNLNNMTTNKFRALGVDVLDHFAKIGVLWKQSNYEGFTKKSKQILGLLRR